MAAKKRGIEDDAAKMLGKLIKSIMKNQASAKTRYNIQKGLKDLERPMSKVSDSPKMKPVPTTKGPKGPVPQRSRPTYKSGGLIQNESQARGAESRANQWLRGQKDLQPQRRPDKVPQSSELPQVGGRSSKSRPLGPNSKYEGDKLRGQTAEDAKKMGRGQPPRGGKNKSGSAEKKQSSKNNPKGKNKKNPKGEGGVSRQKPTPNPTGTSRSRSDIQNKADIMRSRIQAKIDSAKTPIERKKWEQRKKSLDIELNANLRGGRGKYSN